MFEVEPINSLPAGETTTGRCRAILHDWRWLVVVVVTLAAAIIPAVLWPGAMNWMQDEPNLLGQAALDNQAHHLAVRGLNGNFGIPYGPLPTMIYQFLLLFTHDVRVITFIRALCSSAMLAGSLLWISRTLKLWPWFVTAVMLAPFLVWTERDLWDATFAIPIAALAVAAYAHFLRTESGISLAVAVCAGMIGPFIHPQGLPLFGALAGHALFWRFRSLFNRPDRLLVLVALAIVAGINWRYCRVFYDILRSQIWNLKHGYPDQTGRLVALTGPFFAGFNLNGTNWVVPRTGLPGPGYLVPIAMCASQIIFPLIWIGIAGSIVHIILLRRERLTDADIVRADDDARVARNSIVAICLAAFVMQMLLAAALRIPPQPQYSFGTFPIHVLFAWFGVESLRRMRWSVITHRVTETTVVWVNPWLAYVVVAVYGLAVGYLTIGGAWSVHKNGWPRVFLSSSMNNQIEIAQKLNHYSDTWVWTNVERYKHDRFPRSMQTLRLLMPPKAGEARAVSPHGLYIRYVEDNEKVFPETKLSIGDNGLFLQYQIGADPDAQRIELIELTADGPPPGAFELDVMPAERLY
jgi:hypothetical protein